MMGNAMPYSYWNFLVILYCVHLVLFL